MYVCMYVHIDVCTQSELSEWRGVGGGRVRIEEMGRGYSCFDLKNVGCCVVGSQHCDFKTHIDCESSLFNWEIQYTARSKC